MKIKLPSPAMVVALVALIVALGGTAAAGTVLITGAQIKDHSIGMADISNTAVAKLHGLRGPAGQSGAAGVPGAAGTFNPAKITYQQGADVTVAAGTTGFADAACPAGSFPIAGGFFSSVGKVGGNVVFPDHVRVVIYNDTIIDVQIHAYAVCAAP